MVWQSNLGIGVYTVLVGASFSVLRADRNSWIELSTDSE
jgi:hypothetical protein